MPVRQGFFPVQSLVTGRLGQKMGTYRCGDEQK